MIHMHLLNESFKAAAATLYANSCVDKGHFLFWVMSNFPLQDRKLKVNVWKLKKKKRLHFKHKIDSCHIFLGGGDL